MTELILAFDHCILSFMQEISNAFLDGFFKFYTSLGNAGLICIAITLILLAIAKTRKCGLCCAASLVYDLLICNCFLKPVIHRIRPYIYFNDFSPEMLIIEPPHDFSFPSGHTAACFAFSTAVFMYNKKLGVVSYFFSALMGFSRIYLLVHYPTDVFGGIIVGVFCGILAYFTVKSVFKESSPKQA